MAHKIPPEIPSFLWGTATSAYQIEGNNRFSDWWEWEHAGKVPHLSGNACNHAELFREDLQLIAHLGHCAYRFSIEWSRLEPQENIWDDGAMSYYRSLLQELRAHQIEPVVTLHHFTHPAWFTDRGGWLQEDAIFFFSRYVEKVVKSLGPFVRFWITLNEPIIYLYYSYLIGTWPPGFRSFKDALVAYRHLLQAHGAAYRKIHEIYEKFHHGKVWVSFAKHMTYLAPCRSYSLADWTAVFLRNWFSNYLFMEATITGFLFFPGIFCESLKSRQTLDYIAINYYTRHFIRFSGVSGAEIMGQICDCPEHQTQIKERNSLGWEVYPMGLYRLLKTLRRYHLPVMIVENGICTLDDQQRERFIQSHLGAVKRAHGKGIPVFGYFYWSLIDNFEWDKGYKPRFGIVEVNYPNQERKIRQSAQVLAQSCRQWK